MGRSKVGAPAGHSHHRERWPPHAYLVQWRCSSTSLRLLPRIVIRVDVGKSPGTVGADLYSRLFVDEDVVCRAWRKSLETARGKRLRPALIGGLSHPQAKGAGHHGENLVDRMCMWRNAIALRKPEPKHKQARLARIAEEEGRLRSGREHGWCRAPLDVSR